MKIDFSQLPLTNRAFSEKPMQFCETGHKNVLSSIIHLIAVETGDRKAREHWQAAQLRNLLFHASQRSAFWRQRIGTKRNVGDVKLSSLPVLTRADVRTQVESEGSLLRPADPMPVKKHSTSGSSGTPVEFFVSEMNAFYNGIRAFAQSFIEGRDLSLNRVRCKAGIVADDRGFTVTTSPSWAFGLESFIKSGKGKHIQYMHPNIPLLCDQLKRDPIGYLVAGSNFVEFILQHVDPIFLKQAGTEMWVCLGGWPDPEIRKKFSAADIAVRANYSSEEVGLIGHECQAIPGNYHVATSNVIVEVDTSDRFEINNRLAGKVLVTHLHSYATPFIRYDIGDLACLEDSCPCGYNGPVLSNIYGRTKQLLKHPDGRVSPFLIQVSDMGETFAKLTEYRIRQTDIKTIAVEIAAKEAITPEAIDAFKTLLEARAGDAFDVKITQVAAIDWGRDTKRLGFRSDVL
ncbi:MAG: hypothetical protein WCF20_12630 [Methylovirgula sp.]